MTVISWTDDRVEQLKKLWESGLSASQIAAELGNITRNAVIGKVHRLGLSGRAKSPSSAAPRQRKVRPAQHMMRISRPVSRGNTALAHAFEVEVEEPAAYPARTEREHLPLAGRRSGQPGLLFLRRQGADLASLLRAPFARRLSAGERSPPRLAAEHEISEAVLNATKKPHRTDEAFLLPDCIKPGCKRRLCGHAAKPRSRRFALTPSPKPARREPRAS